MTELVPKADALLAAAAAGDADAWGRLLTEHTERLCRIAKFRLDSRLRGRVDASDVVQETFLEATNHRDQFFQQPSIPLFLWLRGIVTNKLLALHRHYLGTRMRDAAREVATARRAGADETSGALAAELSGHGAGPATEAAGAEVKRRMQDALGSIDAMDREVLALRHFEQLSNGEAALVLGILERAAAKRYVRALRRLKQILADMPGGLTGLRS